MLGTYVDVIAQKDTFELKTSIWEYASIKLHNGTRIKGKIIEKNDVFLVIENISFDIGIAKPQDDSVTSGIPILGILLPLQ